MIFNAINSTSYWPLKWKEEHLTIIPKCPKPNDLSECRNISCTPLMSKVLEGVVLERLRAELRLDPDQYGGLMGCSAEHMAIEIWDRVLRVLDNGDNPGCLLGIDFEKAFNRMDHGHCIRQLKNLGASDESIQLVKPFLSDREMTITLEGEQCGSRKIVRGSPQGSVLGGLLYCITTQHLTERGAALEEEEWERPDLIGDGAAPEPQIGVEAVRDGLVAPSAYRFFPGSGSEGNTDEEVNFWDRDSEDDISVLSVMPEVEEQQNEEDAAFKYIDDTTTFSAVCLADAIRHIASGPTVEMVWPWSLEVGLRVMERKANEIGMKVNVKKTQLLCISPKEDWGRRYRANHVRGDPQTCRLHLRHRTYCSSTL